MNTQEILAVPSSIPAFDSPLFAPAVQADDIRLARVEKATSAKSLAREQQAEDRRARALRVFEWVVATYVEAATRQPCVSQRYSELLYRNTRRTPVFVHYMVDVERITKKALGNSSELWAQWCDICEGIDVDSQVKWHLVMRCYPLYKKHVSGGYFLVSKPN